MIYASMRPQRNAAENDGMAARRDGGRSASMRPQRNAAENPEIIVALEILLRASMRPQRNAAENFFTRRSACRRSPPLQ